MVRDHHVGSPAAAVVGAATGATRAVADAADLTDAAGEGGDDLLGAVDGVLLAGADGRDLRSLVAAEAAGGGAAALHLAGAGALVARLAASAVRRPAAVARAAGAALGLGAALDVGRVFGAGARDGGAAGLGAGRRRHAHAGEATLAVAGLVDGGLGTDGEEGD